MTGFDVAADFAKQTAEHQLTVLHDDGMYRHLRCRQPGTVVWGWDVITWPGHLAVAGDLGDWVFARLPDMLLDFFTGPVNPTYWLEKCTAWDRHAHRGGLVSWPVIQSQVDEDDEPLPEDVIAMLRDLHGTPDVHEAYRLLMDVADIPDAWEWTVTEPDIHAVRILHAIAWTRDHYQEHRHA